MTIQLKITEAYSEAAFDATCEECGNAYFRSEEIYEDLCLPCGKSELAEDEALSSRYN